MSYNFARSLKKHAGQCKLGEKTLMKKSFYHKIHNRQLTVCLHSRKWKKTTSKCDRNLCVLDVFCTKNPHISCLCQTVSELPETVVEDVLLHPEGPLMSNSGQKKKNRERGKVKQRFGPKWLITSAHVSFTILTKCTSKIPVIILILRGAHYSCMF